MSSTAPTAAAPTASDLFLSFFFSVRHFVLPVVAGVRSAKH